MMYWEFQDGTTVRSRAVVEGSSAFAAHLRRELVSLCHGLGPLLRPGTRPGLVELDPASDELLAQWLDQEARSHGARLCRTNYAARPAAKGREPVLTG